MIHELWITSGAVIAAAGSKRAPPRGLATPSTHHSQRNHPCIWKTCQRMKAIAITPVARWSV